MMIHLDAYIDILKSPDSTTTRTHTVFLRLPSSPIFKLGEIHHHPSKDGHDAWDFKASKIGEDIHSYHLEDILAYSLPAIRAEIIMAITEQLLRNAPIHYDKHDMEDVGGWPKDLPWRNFEKEQDW